MVHVGVCGVGHLGSIHLKCLEELGAAAGFFDPDAAACARVAAGTSVPAFPSYDALLDAVDAVVIAAPTALHADLAEAALLRGRHVFIEKPVAATAAEGDRLRALAAARGLAVAVGHVERFNPAYRAALPHLAGTERIAAQRIAPFTPRGADVSVVHDLMIHDLDALLGAWGDDVVEVVASGERTVTDTVDTARARLVWRSGRVAEVVASRTGTDRIRRWEAFGEAMKLEVDFLTRTAARTTSDGMQPLDVEEGNPLKDELQAFLKAAQGAGAVGVTLEEGLSALGLAERILACIGTPTFAA